MNELIELIPQFTQVITGCIEPVTKFGQAISGFVAAFSPATVELYNLALKNVTATIGAAFQPALLILSDTLQQIAAALDPAMRSLAPVFQRLAEIISAIVVPIVNVLASTLTALAPLFDALLEAVQAFMPLITAFGAALSSLIVVLKPVFDILVTVIKSVAEAFKELVKTIIFLYAEMLRLIGANETLRAFIDSLKPKAPVSNLAPQNTGITGVEEISRQLAIAAAQAAPTVAKTQDEYLAEILEGVQAIAEGRSLTEQIEDAIEDWWVGAWVAIRSWWDEEPIAGVKAVPADGFNSPRAIDSGGDF